MDNESHSYVEEAFSILTDDNTYIDCILVKPAGLADEALRSLHVWVPRYPLTMSSVIACARQEARAAGANAKLAHLVFDLRGTGHSDGEAGDLSFERDLDGIRLWAEERFRKVGVRFLGRPHGSGQVDVWPVRPGVVVETYHYRPATASGKSPVIYLGTYGHFTDEDDQCCATLAKAGYDVYGMDPLRYLLHASTQGRLQASEIWRDLTHFGGHLRANPFLLGMPVSAGLALFWASGVESIQGVTAIGQAQIAFKPNHIFQNDNPHRFFLSRYLHRIAPQPVAFVMVTGNRLGGDRDEMAALYQACTGPRRIDQVQKVMPDFLLELLAWMQQKAGT